MAVSKNTRRSDGQISDQAILVHGTCFRHGEKSDGGRTMDQGPDDDPTEEGREARPLAPKSKGHPYHADTMRQRHLNKAAAKIGLPKLGWQAFRHTYRARLSELGLPLEVQQKLMRHASIDMTTNYGRNSMLKVTRPANALIVEMVMRKDGGKSEKGTGCTACSLFVPSPFPADLVSC